MKENKYDDNIFFQKYSQMSRSQKGLAGAGEWETLKKMLPDFKGKRVLDLGCGYGWHCIYAMENGASSVVGVDISHKMLEVAKGKTHFPQIEYECCAIEDVDFPEESLLMEHKTGIITKKEKYCISRWTIIIMRANGQLCFWKKRLQNIIEH